jgi:hypothetical protein
MEISYLAPQDDAIWAHGSVVLGLRGGRRARATIARDNRSLPYKKIKVIIDWIALEKQIH